MSRMCFFSFEGARITLSATGMCVAWCCIGSLSCPIAVFYASGWGYVLCNS